MLEPEKSQKQEKGVHIKTPGFVLDEQGSFPERLPSTLIVGKPEQFRSELVEWIYRESVGPSIENYHEIEFLKIVLHYTVSSTNDNIEGGGVNY